jgi:hypothetical protein
MITNPPASLSTFTIAESFGRHTHPHLTVHPKFLPLMDTDLNLFWITSSFFVLLQQQELEYFPHLLDFLILPYIILLTYCRYKPVITPKDERRMSINTFFYFERGFHTYNCMEFLLILLNM